MEVIRGGIAGCIKVSAIRENRYSAKSIFFILFHRLYKGYFLIMRFISWVLPFQVNSSESIKTRFSSSGGDGHCFGKISHFDLDSCKKDN